MRGTLYGVGVGPGDPELLTLKAVRLISRCSVIAVPESGGEDNTALSIAKAAVPQLMEKEMIKVPMPMIRDREKLEQSHREAARLLEAFLEKGQDVVFLTLGDSTIYSTYSYLHRLIVQDGYTAQFVPGVPSFCAAAAKLNQPLAEGSKPIHIIPASYDGLDEGLGFSGTRVLMKTGKSMPRVIKALKEQGLLDRTSLVQRCGMEGEQVYPTLQNVPEDASYFSILIVKEK